MGLENPVLVLNKGWSPIDACTARDAISDAFSAKARIICPETYAQYNIEQWLGLPVNDGDSFIQGTSQRVRVPEVIVSTYDRIPNRKVVFSRRNLWKRDRFRCQYCGVRPRQDDVTIDHVVPRSQGGKTTFTNCVLACIKCNKRKDNRTPEQAKMPLVKIVSANGKTHKEIYDRPKAPKWSPVYAVPRYQKFPKSWGKFLQDMIDDLYWNTELET